MTAIFTTVVDTKFEPPTKKMTPDKKNEPPEKWSTEEKNY